MVAATQRRTVSAVLRLAGSSCLVRSAVLQRWDAAHGQLRSLMVGVTRTPDGAVVAHAWLEGDPRTEGYVELHRHPPVAGGRATLS